MTSATSSSGPRSTSIPPTPRSPRSPIRCPQILDGIPLRLRSIRINLDRPDFTLNPTNCDPFSVERQDRRRRRRRGRPRRALPGRQLRRPCRSPRSSRCRLSGGDQAGAATRRSTRPCTAAPGRSQHRHVPSVTLPHSELLDNAHISSACTRVQFAADACPPGSRDRQRHAPTPRCSTSRSKDRSTCERLRAQAARPRRRPQGPDRHRPRRPDRHRQRRPAHDLRNGPRRPGEQRSPSTSPAAPRACFRTAKPSAAGVRSRSSRLPARTASTPTRDATIQTPCGKASTRHRRHRNRARAAR